MSQRDRQDRHTNLLAKVAHEALGAGSRYVPYANLLVTGRAVRYHHRPGSEAEWWIELQLAGEQGADFDAAAQNRSFYIGYDTEQQARRNGDHILHRLGQMHRAGRINTDTRYNMIIEAVAKAARERVEQENERLLREAEEAVRVMPKPDIGKTLRDLVREKYEEQSASSSSREGDK